MLRFFGFLKGWIARVLPELMPKGSLQRCQDLNFSIEGGLRCCREFHRLITPSGVTSLTDEIKAFFQHTSGTTISTFILKEGDLFRDLNGAGFNSLITVSATTYNYTTSFTENDTSGSSITIYTNKSGATITTCLDSTKSTDLALYRVESNPGDFEYKFDFKCTSVVVDNVSGNSICDVYLWGVSDGFGLPVGYSNDKITLEWIARQSGSSVCLRQRYNNSTNVQSRFSGVTIGSRRYYATIKKDSSIGSYGRVTCELFNETSRTNSLGSMSIDLTKSFPTSHLFAFSAWGGIIINDAWSGEVRNLVKTTGQVSADEDRAIFKVMTPSLSSKPFVYMSTADNLLRSAGESKYTSGSTWVQVGVPAPTGMSSCKVASGSLTGAYKVAYTYYDSETGAESELSGISTLTCSGSEKIQVKWQTGSAYTGHANQVRIYRSISGGGTLYYVKSVTINRSAATQKDSHTTADTSLGDPLGDVGKPPSRSGLVESWKGRLWVSGVSAFQGEDTYNRIYFSRNLNPETVPPDYYLAVANSESVVKAMVVFEGSLYVLTESDIYEVEGTTSDSFKLSDSLAPYGTTSTDSVAVGKKGIYFVSSDGIYRFRYKGEKISDQIEWMFKDSEDTWNTRLASSAIASAKGWWYDGLYYCTIGGSTLIFDETQDRWRKRSKRFTCGWRDGINNRFYVGVSSPPYYMVGYLINDDSSGVSGLASPDFITRPTYLINPSEEDPIPKVGKVRKFKVNAEGYWTFYFYCDDTLAHTESGTTYTGASRNEIRNLTADIKGTTMYIRGVAGCNPAPNKTRFYSIEVF